MSACNKPPELTDATQTSQSISKPAGLIVSIQPSSFVPGQIEVKVGESVTWVNDDTAVHTVTSWHQYQDQDNVPRVDIGDLWDSGNLAPGQSYSHIFTEEGSFEYVSLPLYLYFQYQQNPTGVVVVSPGSSGNSNSPATAISETSATNKTAGTYSPVISYVLITSVPAGGGFIIVTPSSKDGSYPSGTIVTLRAVADQDHAFNNWDGDASGIKEIITLIMDSDKNVTAYFIPM
jgi:plastocyanin